MNKNYLVLFVAASLVLVGCNDNSAENSVNEKTVNVKVTRVSNSFLSEDKRYTGTVEESNGTFLSFPVMGTIKNFYVRTGERVVKGQIIASVDQTTLKNSYEVAKVSLEQVQDAYERLKILYEEKSLPEMKWVDMQTKLQQAKAMEKIARKNLKDCELKAPFDGIIADKKAEIGQNVAPGVPIVNLVSTRYVNVKVSVPECDINTIQIGDRAKICVSAAGNVYLDGTLIEKGVVANPLSRSYDIKVAIENKENVLLPGMITDVYIMNSGETSAIVLPANIIQVDNDNQTFVWVNQNGAARKKVVVCGEYTSNGVVVESGISCGDEIIISGQHKICEGSIISL